MIVDYLHSFYTMPARLWVGGAERIVTLRWFRAPAGAKKLPFPTCFFTHVDDKVWERNPGEPGEVNYPRVHDQGRNNGYQGQCYLGDPAWFLTGQLPASVLNPPPPSTCLCQVPPAQAAGALVLSGAAVASTSVCELTGALVYVDPLDGTGPKRWSFAQAIGAYSVYTASGGIPPVGSVRAVGVPSPGGCVTLGLAFFASQPPPGHFVYNVFGAIHYLFDSRHARWDWFNDGTVTSDVYTRVP